MSVGFAALWGWQCISPPAVCGCHMERFLGKRNASIGSIFKKKISKLQIAQALGIVCDGAHKRVEQELGFGDPNWSSPDR